MMNRVMVGVETRAVAAGFEDGKLRVTLLFHPTARAEGRQVDIATWPSVVGQVMGMAAAQPTVAPEKQPRHASTLKLCAIQLPHGTAPVRPAACIDRDMFDATLPKAAPSVETTSRILDLWRRAMVPGSIAADPYDQAAWEWVRQALPRVGAAPARPAPRTVVPTPDSEASLALTLERGRLALDALAGPHSPLLSRPPARDPGWRWDGGVRIATSFATLSDAGSGLLSASQLECCTRATTDLNEGRVPDPMWPGAESFAAAALSDGETLDPLLERIQEMHLASTPAFPANDPVAEAREMRELDAARRRLGTVLSLPVLQRLFGFAVDVLVPMDQFPISADGIKPSFLALAVAWDNSVWTIARLEPHRFVPATEAEVRDVDATGPDRWSGLKNLGVVGTMVPDPRYDLCTIDAATSVEGMNVSAGSAAAEQKGRGRARGAPPSITLRNGGLRLIDRDSLATGFGQDEVSRQQLGPVRLDGAERLAMGERLLVGVRTKAGGPLEWRCPQLRVVTYADPRAEERYADLGFKPSDDARCWVEDELRRRLGEPDGPRRLELDAAPLRGAASYTMIDENAAPNKGSDDAQKAREKRDSQFQMITFSSVASWGGEPMGVPASEGGKVVGDHVEWSTYVTDELDVSRRFAPVTSASGKAGAVGQGRALTPLLRFGWPYHVALPTVFDGGGALTFDEVSALVAERDTLVLPRAGAATLSLGRRFLRHERIDAPMVLFPDSHWAAVKPAGIQGGTQDGAQGGADMLVRSQLGPGHQALAATRRILVAPPVAFHFAALHDAFRGMAAAHPPQGLAGLSLLPAVPSGKGAAETPARVRVGGRRGDERATPAYYPDPAASLLMLGLFGTDPDLPVADQEMAGKAAKVFPGVRERPGAPIGDPLVVAIAATWPQTVPVHLELKVAPAGTPPALRHVGRRWLGRNEVLLTQPQPGAVLVQAVEIALQPGADVWVQAWIAPTADQLAKWFDAVEAANALAVFAGGTEQDPTKAMLDGLRALGCLPAEQSAGPPAQPGGSGLTCTAAGGLRTAPPTATRLLAGMLHARLLRAPLPFLSAPQPFRATHATGKATQPVFATEGPRLARRLLHVEPQGPATDPAAEAPDRLGALLAEFFGSLPSDIWAERTTEAGATGILLGGELSIDLATTGALEVVASLASPSGDDLDRVQPLARSRMSAAVTEAPEDSRKRLGFDLDKDGRPSFPSRTLVVLRLDGLPPPPDGQPQSRTVRLEDLQAAAWGEAKPLGRALRASMPEPLTTHGARHMRLWLHAINRHAAFLPAPEVSSALPEHVPSVNVWLSATVRPAPPDIDRVQAALSEHPTRGSVVLGTVSAGLQRRSSLRIWLRRPWWSSGEGERLGIVLWPPNLGARGTTPHEGTMPTQVIALLDEDIGPGGRYVSRWGADPLEAETEAPAPGLFLPRHVDVLPGAASPVYVPRAWMPVPAQETSESPVASAPDRATPVRFMAVALMTYAPRFDPVEELWYVDMTLATDPVPMPRVRLSLVRYQPHAREDEQPIEGEEPVRLRVSPPVVEWTQSLPARRVEASWSTAAGATTVLVTVTGPGSAGIEGWGASRLEVEVLRYRPKKEGRPALEEAAAGADGQPLVCSSWASNGPGLVRRAEGQASWTCAFTIPGPIEADGWSHAVLVKETRTLEPATIATVGPDGGPPPARLESGPGYITRLDLKAPS